REGVGTVRVPLFSREAAGLFVLGLTALAWLAEVEPLRPEGRVRLVHGEPGLQTLAFVPSPDGTKMATTDAAGRLRLREARSGWATERSLPFPGYAREMAFSPDGRFLVCGGFGSGITLYDLESDAEARTLPV